VVGPYSGDDDNDGSASLRYRVVGDPSWIGPIVMHKGGLAYRALLDLQMGVGYEIEVAYYDPEGVSGENHQVFTASLAKTCTPLIMASYAD
jgi:hypothetical protein